MINYMQKILSCVILLLLPLCGRAQWRLLNDFDKSLDVDIRADVSLSSIYFLDLPGQPRIGFAGLDNIYTDSNQVWKTTDGGWTWYPVHAAYNANGPFIGMDVFNFAFKDSTTGWFANDWATGGCFTTTNAGETWSEVLTPIPFYECSFVYYHHATGLLFTTFDGTQPGLLSTDEGASWQEINLIPEGFSFSDDSTGIVLSQTNIYYTIDGGKTWKPSTYTTPTACIRPLAIKGTKTFFMVEGLGRVLRSDDGGVTWRQLSVLPPINQTLVFQSTALFGDFQGLYTQSSEGVFVSKDSGNTWQSLCGPVCVLSSTHVTSFFERDRKIYAGEDNDATQGRLWYLNIDSLNIFSSSLHPSQSAANGMSVLFQPQIDSTVGVDTAHFAIRYDTSLLLHSLQLPAGWNLLDSSSNGNILNVTIFDTSSMVDTPSVTLNFEPILTPSKNFGMVWLDSANLYGKWMNCDIYASSVAGPDSVQLNFVPECGDSLILAAMNDSLPFYIESIQPNPASSSIEINLSSSSSVTYTLFDALGCSILSNSNSASSFLLDISNVPSGIYYLRISSNTYVQSRSISIAR
jgi:hypothetical protein